MSDGETARVMRDEEERCFIANAPETIKLLLAEQCRSLQDIVESMAEQVAQNGTCFDRVLDQVNKNFVSYFVNGTAVLQSSE